MRVLALAILMACASGSIAQAQQTKDFKDWVVGCDNLRGCTAVGVTPEDGAQNAFIKVTRAGDATAEPSVTFALWDEGPEGPVSLELSLDNGGSGVPLRMEATRDGQYARATLSGAQARAALDAMRQAKSLTIRQSDKTGTVSLAGSAASLLYMDAQQKRAKTVTALVAKGDTSGSGIPSVPPTPVVAGQPMQEMKEPLPRPPTGVVRRGDDECGSSADPVLAIELSPEATLWGICSAAGAYNFRYRFTLVSRGKAALARFSVPGQVQDQEEESTLVSPSLSKDGKILSSFDKGRGMGDCGVSADWAWDGKTFHLMEYRSMGQCRGIPWDDWPVLFRAQRR